MQSVRVLNWPDTAEGGVGGAVRVEVSAYAKRNYPGSPYLVANEVVAGAIGQYLGLPVAPFALATRHDGVYFLSLEFNLTGTRLPPINPERIVATFPNESAGVVAFDAFIANFDRHYNNMAAVLETEPQRLALFDHERSLLGLWSGNAPEHLRAITGQLVIGGNGVYSRHCLLDHIVDLSHMSGWLDAIEHIPQSFVRRTAARAQEVGGIANAERQALEEFLQDRSQRLRSILRTAQQNGIFPSAQQGGLF